MEPEEGYSNWKARLPQGSGIPHYYGDIVRILFLLMAVESFVVVPLLGDLLPFGIVAEVGAGVLLVLLAGLTNAKSMIVLIADATLAGVSVLLLEMTAITMRTTDSMQLFAAREVGVLLMLGALYFSVKTIRGMMAGKIGHADSPLEFDEAVTETE